MPHDTAPPFCATVTDTLFVESSVETNTTESSLAEDEVFALVVVIVALIAPELNDRDMDTHDGFDDTLIWDEDVKFTELPLFVLRMLTVEDWPEDDPQDIMLGLAERAILLAGCCPIMQAVAFKVSSVDATPIVAVRWVVLVFAVAENDTIICPALVSVSEETVSHEALEVARICEVLVNGIAVPEVVFLVT